MRTICNISKKNNFKYKLSISLILILSVVYSLPYSPIFENLRYDREIYQYFGMIIHEGLIPYIDAFDHKPPLIYLLNYFGVLFSSNSTWGIYIIQNSLVFFSSFLIFKLARKKLKNIILALLIAAIFISFMNSSVFLWGGNHTRQFACLFTVWVMYIIFSYHKTKKKSIALGVSLGLIFFVQQNEILGGIVLIFYYLLLTKNFKFQPIKK